MEKFNSFIGDRDDLTEEQRQELERGFAEIYEWEKAHGWYDEHPDENSPDEKAWYDYQVERARFADEAERFYRKYLEYKGEKNPSIELLSIFKYNIRLLNFFLNRIKEGEKKGTEIIIEFQAIMKLHEGKPFKLVDEDRKLEPLRTSLRDMGFDTKTKQTWSAGFGSKHEKKVDKIMKEYKVFLERNQ